MQYFKNEKVTLYHNDALQQLKEFNDSSIDVIITSPPYNIGKEYEVNTSIEEYINYHTNVVKELFRVVKGNILYQVGNTKDNSELLPLDYVFYNIFKETGYKLIDRIIWNFPSGYHARKKFSNRYETVLWFSKTDNYIFNLDEIRVPQKYPNKKGYKGKNKGKLTGNPLGKNPSNVWQITNIKANHGEKTNHPCQFPEELVRRLVLSMSNEKDIILDPFVGSGTTLKVSDENNRYSIGIDFLSEYLDICIERLNNE